MSYQHENLVEQSTSYTLIHRAKLHDPEAWVQLVRAYGPLIYNHARTLGLTPDESADVTQETLSAVFTSLERFQREKDYDGFRKWLKGITRNKVRDYFRLRHKQPGGVGGSHAHHRLLQITADEPASFSHVDSDSTLLVRRALTIIEDDFQPQTWQAFWRTTVENQNATKVSQELGITAQAVRKAKSRVMARLRDELQHLRSLGTT